MAVQTTVYDNLTNFSGGMNGNIISSMLSDRQYLKGVNITCRGGVLRTRPPFMARDFIFGNPTDQRIFEQGRWQGAKEYITSTWAYVVASVSGNVFLIDPDTGVVSNVSGSVGRMSQYNNRLYFQQAEKYFIIQDGVNLPIIMDGLTASRATRDANNVVPTGTIMAYGHGRLFIKISKNQFLAGDIYQPTNPQSLLKFTETQYLNGGGAFGVPTDLGEITGMVFTQNYDTGDGQGPLIVFCENGFDAFNVYSPRALMWSENDISRVQMRGVGCASHNCIVVTGDDLIFRTYTGLGSYSLYKTQDRRFTDMAEELLPFEQEETQWARALSSGALFDNRVLFTMVAEKVTALDLDGNEIDDYRFKALGVLDLAPLNGLSEVNKSGMMVYDGAWTGPHPTTIISSTFDGEPRCFVFGKTDGGRNVMYELGTKPGNDCEGSRVNCRFYPKYTRFFAFPPGGNPVEQTYNFKRIDRTAIYVPRFEGNVDFRWLVKPDGRTDFTQISAMSIKAPMVHDEPPYADLIGGMAQARSKLTFPQFKDDLGDPVKGINLLKAFEYEFCLEWDGIAEIRRIALEATVQPRSPDFIPDENKILPINQRDDLAYSIACGESVLRNSLMFANFLEITLGSRAYWSIGATPGTLWVDSTGTPVVAGQPYTTPSLPVWPIQDPSKEPDWFDWEAWLAKWKKEQEDNPPADPYKPPSQPPSPTWPPAGWPPSPMPIPAPGNPPAVQPPNIGPGGNSTGSQEYVYKTDLPKPTDPPNNITGATLVISSPAKVERDAALSVGIQLMKTIKVGDQTYFQQWKSPPVGMTVTLSLDPGNGDSWVLASFPAMWDADGKMTATSVCSGGTLEANNTKLIGTVSLP